MDKITKIISILKEQQSNNEKLLYKIPKNMDYQNNFNHLITDEDYITVNPYEFFHYYLDKGIVMKKNSICSDCSNDFAIYCMLVRSLTAWNYEGINCIGTFLKAIMYLPLLADSGFNIIYLLPIFEIGEKYKKGDLGSLYAVKDIFKLDYRLHDKLLGDYSEELINDEFMAFVEVAHILGLKVFMDFPLRSVSRESVLIKNYPDWFYWVNKKYAHDFPVPISNITTDPFWIDESNVKEFLLDINLNMYISMFSLSPNLLDNQKWSKVGAIKSDEMIDFIEDEFGVTTVPGFSDGVNDIQPVWTDITFYRIYKDLHKYYKDLSFNNDVPFILQDSIKQNILTGSQPNEELWNYLSSIIPYYIIHFDIDGCRIDMSHALPDELNRKIVNEINKVKKNFSIISEDYEIKNSHACKKNGYTLITGNVWYHIWRLNEGDSFNELIQEIKSSELPLLSALETHDTPRSASRLDDVNKMKSLLLFSFLLPNTIPYICCGQEILERQPITLGLDNTEDGKYMLSRDNRQFGKMALFDYYELDWINNNSILKEINEFLKLRYKYIDNILKKENLLFYKLDSKQIIRMDYYNYQIDTGLLLIFNCNSNYESKLDNNAFTKGVFSHDFNLKYDLIYGKNDILNNLEIKISPFEILVYRIYK